MISYRKLFIVASAASAFAAQMLAGYSSQGQQGRADADVKDTVVVDDRFPAPHQGIVEAKIMMLARAYGDSIVLRWAGEDFVTQRRLHMTGVDLYRIDKTDGKVDTLVMGFKPWTLEQMKAFYPETDSLAYGAMGLMYNDTHLMPDQTNAEAGTFESLLEIHDDQQTRFGFTVILSEWRTDLANRLAMRWTDRKVVRGHHYEYILQPSERNSRSSLVMGAGHIADIENVPYERKKLQMEMGDTITGPNSVRLWWQPLPYSTYEIDRRRSDEIMWTRVNKNPYLMMSVGTTDEQDCFYKDIVEQPGDYEYRIMAHDAFGDLTLPSDVYKVHIPDMMGPNSPKIHAIEINHTDPNDLMKGVTATFHISKDSIEDDFVGFMPLYYHEKWTGKEWKRLSRQYFGANDTVFTVDVTGLSTGMVTVGAYDEAGNASFAMPTLLRLQDVKAPDAPRNLKAETDAATGTIKLTWEADEDDIEYFEVAFANDTTHQFMLASTKKSAEMCFVDTVDTQVNQRYIYYKVRAIDYSTNEGAYTPPFRVQRPSTLVPSQPHIDSTWVNTDGIHMRWGCPDEQQIDEHRLYRRLEHSRSKTNTWQLIGTFNPDSVRANGNYVEICDVPDYIRDDRYLYAMESVSCNGLTSGKSVAYSVAWAGETVFDWDIDLMGVFEEKAGTTRIAWETDTNLPYKGEWYFCIWRKGPKDNRFKFLMSSAPNDMLHTDYLLQPGEEAQYFVMIQFADGRESTPSNIVTIKAPAK